jgi:hypothetical protein
MHAILVQMYRSSKIILISCNYPFSSFLFLVFFIHLSLLSFLTLLNLPNSFFKPLHKINSYLLPLYLEPLFNSALFLALPFILTILIFSITHYPPPPTPNPTPPPLLTLRKRNWPNENGSHPFGSL